jgi:hypothetical protein
MSKTQANPILLENIEIILKIKHICRNMRLRLEYAITTKKKSKYAFAYAHMHFQKIRALVISYGQTEFDTYLGVITVDQ